MNSNRIIESRKSLEFHLHIAIKMYVGEGYADLNPPKWESTELNNEIVKPLSAMSLLRDHILKEEEDVTAHQLKEVINGNSIR